jgi:hypothetical protein
MDFWPIQSAALYEAALCNGLFAPLGVGQGKSLICLALPDALDSKRAVLLVPATLRRQVTREARTLYNRHFVLPMEKLTIVSYEELSSTNSHDVLDRLQPDLIICDECHFLRNFSAARTKRFLRYMKEHPHCRFAALSGTITTRSINDYGHLIELALRKNSPLPRSYPELLDWSGALDAKPIRPRNPGVLRQFCRHKESVRDGFRRRLTETQGVVATKESALEMSLIVRRLKMQVPIEVQECLNGVRKTWSIDGNEFDSILTLKGALRQVACGFFYRWVWPDGEVDHAWLEARNDWNKEVRGKLSLGSRPNMDTPFFLAAAAERFRKWVLDPSKPKPDQPLWESETWPTWRKYKDQEDPPREPVWISDYMVDAAVAWGKKQKTGAVIWYAWRALGEAIAKKGKFSIYGENSDSSMATAPVIVCSMYAQKEGKNLQHRYWKNLLTTLPGNGAAFEQIVGRTHRPLQKADEVTVEYFGHTPEVEDLMDSIIEDEQYVFETTGQTRKILYATKIR